MTRTACFDRDRCWCKLLKKRNHILAPQLLAQNRRLGGIHPVKLKNVFRGIHSNAANLFHGRSPTSEIFNDLTLPQTMPWGPSTPTSWPLLALYVDRRHQ